MKFIKTFHGVPDGAIYPVEYAPGAECPPELEAGARSLDALAQVGNDRQAWMAKTSAEIKAALDAARIAYDGRASKADLVALLPIG